MAARTLLKMAYVEIRRFEKGTQDKIAGIQRERSEGRIAEIKKYVNLEYATFPTSIIISVPTECVELKAFCSGDDPSDEDEVLMMELSPFGNPEDEDFIPTQKIAYIIDGQHRLAGLEALQEGREFDLNVSIFLGASDADKAEIFARVNQAQTKVNQSLVVDLASFYEERGPVKFAHEVVLSLNNDKDGPLHDKVKRLGKASPGKGRIQTLAQATVVKPVVDYITSDPEAERNKRYKGLFASRRAPDAWRRFIFQPFFDNDDDGGVFACLANYFSAVEARWPDSWNDAPVGSILNRTTGYVALMRFLRPVYLRSCSKAGEVLSRASCDSIFASIKIQDEEFTRDNFLPGSAGISALYRRLLAESGLKEN
jgi:DGQHR domain-containing protein